jgi:hypothetical protein
MAKEKKYKVEKLLPISEISKPLSHHKEKKNYVIAERYTKIYCDARIKEYLKAIAELKQNNWHPRFGKKYVSLQDAEKAMRHFLKQQSTRRFSSYIFKTYEFRIKEIKEEK